MSVPCKICGRPADLGQGHCGHHLRYASSETQRLAREAAERQAKMTDADRDRAIRQLVEDVKDAGDKEGGT